MTKWAYVENNEIKGVYDKLPRSWRNISGFEHLESDLELLESYGWQVIDKSNTSFDREKYNEMGFNYTLVDNRVIATPILVEKVTNNQVYDLEFIRMQRNQLLEKSDVYQLSDWQTSFDDILKIDWLFYRQKLRNATNNVYEFDFNSLQSELEMLIDRSRSAFDQYISSNNYG
jgi:hypothetical protein